MKKNILLAACFGISLFASAQNDTLTHEREITLAEAIALARTQSVDAAVALNELKTPFQNGRVLIKIEKGHCMIRGSSGETICFLRRNRKFHGVKQRVPQHGTPCFPT